MKAVQIQQTWCLPYTWRECWYLCPRVSGLPLLADKEFCLFSDDQSIVRYIHTPLLLHCSVLLCGYISYHKQLRPKKNCYIGVTRPTLKLGPNLLFKTKKTKKKRQKNDRPILKKAKPVIFFLTSYFGSKNVNFGVWDLVGSLKCVFHIPAEISILPKMSRHSCIEPTIWNV